MNYFPSSFGALALTVSAGVWLGPLSPAAAQTTEPAPASVAPVAAAASPAAADEKLASEMVAAGAKERHLAPHDTFYLVSYVAVKTGTGVEGFDPGQEVRLVEVHRATNTLVVTNGHAQVEVPPAQLTNDMDIAALVRQKDETSQARIAAHLQAEQKAYAKFEREAADATAKDLAHRQQEQQAQAAAIRAQEQTPVAQIATPAPSQGVDVDGYYGYGGYGYGSPYPYFSGPSVATAPRNGNARAAGQTSGNGSSAGQAGTNPATVGTAGRPPR